MVDGLPAEDAEPWIRELFTDVSLASSLNIPLVEVSRLKGKARQALVVYLNARERRRKEEEIIARRRARVGRRF